MHIDAVLAFTWYEYKAGRTAHMNMKIVKRLLLMVWTTASSLLLVDVEAENPKCPANSFGSKDVNISSICFPAPLNWNTADAPPPNKYALPKLTTGAGVVVIFLPLLVVLLLWIRQIEESKQKRIETPNPAYQILVAVESDGPDKEQYGGVMQRLQETMPGVQISKLWRIRNPKLFDYYAFQKQRLRKETIDLNERHVWHGTSTLDPEVIYKDRKDGFMIQWSSDGGFWG
jgi:hypothetical protein